MASESRHRKFAVGLMYAVAAAAAFYLVFNRLWGVLFPFFAAYALAECFKPIVRYSETHKRFPKRLVVAAVLIIAAGAVATLIFAACRELLREIYELAGKAGEFVMRVREDDEFAGEIIDGICSLVPFVDLKDKLWEIRPEIDEKLLSALASSADRIAEWVISVAGSAVSFLPDAILSSVVTVISAYYFAVDRVRINCFFLGLFPERVRPKLKETKDLVCGTAANYLRAYGLIFLITFGELWAAFRILGVEYGFVIALATALIDILPVLGTGFVLVPWAAVELISGATGTGIGLLVAFAVITVVRQVAEPKIVGRFIGLPPVAALASMFIGLKLAGFAGIFIFPLGFMVLYGVLEKRGFFRGETTEKNMN